MYNFIISILYYIILYYIYYIYYNIYNILYIYIICIIYINNILAIYIPHLHTKLPPFNASFNLSYFPITSSTDDHTKQNDMHK